MDFRCGLHGTKWKGDEVMLEVEKAQTADTYVWKCVESWGWETWDSL